jgi:hypothetical protein
MISKPDFQHWIARHHSASDAEINKATIEMNTVCMKLLLR